MQAFVAPIASLISWTLLIGCAVGTPVRRFWPSMLALIFAIVVGAFATLECCLSDLLAVLLGCIVAFHSAILASCAGALLSMWCVVGWAVVLFSLPGEIWLADCFLLSAFDGLRPFSVWSTFPHDQCCGRPGIPGCPPCWPSVLPGGIPSLLCRFAPEHSIPPFLASCAGTILPVWLDGFLCWTVPYHLNGSAVVELPIPPLLTPCSGRPAIGVVGWSVWISDLLGDQLIEGFWFIWLAHVNFLALFALLFAHLRQL
ncbi:hypothetical protein Nepgr_031823 [Nepenthes gracilis]|uniref:Uncharacterized protein n=1 Tax=Nepenthes gracilis TaxID=150966 RepID=A0AAD3TI25_NEPGR|nr:hypothetical protein Nepgr_031823 [Nepenthes gracilis]